MSGGVRRRWPPKSLFGRILFGLRFLALILFFAIAFGVFCVLVENRFPSGDLKHALFPAAQRAVTKPVVNALGRQAQAYLRRRAEAKYMNTGLSVEETIRRFLDPSVDWTERRAFAYRLARVASPECIAALLSVLEIAPAEQKAFMAKLIGSTRNPSAKAALWSLLQDPDERVVMATISGLSAIGGDDVAGRIAVIMSDSGQSDQIRTAAAMGLGTIGTPAACQALIVSLSEPLSNGLTTQILNGLGRFKFSAVENTFRQYLDAPETRPEMRVAALEALATSSVEAVPFLLRFAQDDNDAEARASAAWAISAHVNVTDLGPKLSEIAERESAPDVRRRLYEALLPQDVIPAERLLPIIQAEEEIAARVAGFNAIGHAASQQPASTITATFDQQIVPELLKIATSPNSLNIQMRAVFALRRARTPAANSALGTIAYTARPQIAAAARHGL